MSEKNLVRKIHWYLFIISPKKYDFNIKVSKDHLFARYITIYQILRLFLPTVMHNSPSIVSGLAVGVCVKPVKINRFACFNVTWSMGFGWVVSVDEPLTKATFSWSLEINQLLLPKQNPELIGVTVKAPYISCK